MLMLLGMTDRSIAAEIRSGKISFFARYSRHVFGLALDDRSSTDDRSFKINCHIRAKCPIFVHEKLLSNNKMPFFGGGNFFDGISKKTHAAKETVTHNRLNLQILMIYFDYKMTFNESFSF